MMPTIRTIFQRETDVEVDEAEAAALRLQGLVHEATAPPTDGKPDPVAAKTPAATPTKTLPGTDSPGEQSDQAPTSQKG